MACLACAYNSLAASSLDFTPLGREACAGSGEAAVLAAATSGGTWVNSERCGSSVRCGCGCSARCGLDDRALVLAKDE